MKYVYSICYYEWGEPKRYGHIGLFFSKKATAETYCREFNRRYKDAQNVHPVFPVKFELIQQ